MKVRQTADVIHGKQKDIALISARRLEFKFTDRTTVFDVNQPFMIPQKGIALAQTNRHWFEMAMYLGIDSHFVRMSGPDSMVVSRENPVPLEFITRYYVDGNLWRRIQSGEVKGTDLGFPNGYEVKRGDKLPKPVFEVTTKREDVDRLLTEEEALKVGGISEMDLRNIRQVIMELDERLHETIKGSGLIHFDGKKEVALRRKTGRVVIVDSFGNADEDRYVEEDDYNAGRIVERSKELFRRHYIDIGYYDRLMQARAQGLADPRMPKPTKELVIAGTNMYMDTYERLTGSTLRVGNPGFFGSMLRH